MKRASRSIRSRQAVAYDYCIIGGGVAGTTAAETLRQRDAGATIAVVSDEPHRFYSRILLSKPNFFLGKIPFDQIWLKTLQWYRELKIDLLAGQRATAVDAAAHTVTLDGKKTLRYRKLLIATGAQAVPWPADGADKKGVLYLRTLDDAKQIIAAIKKAKRAVCVGSGFTSFEMCEMLTMAGLQVTLVMREPHYWDPLLDEQSGKMIEAALLSGGVKIHRNALVKTVDGRAKVSGVTLESGQNIPCEVIVAGVGAQPDLSWLQGSTVKTNRGILADEYLKTSAPDVYTAGDCAEFNDLILDEHVLLGNWVNAQMHGKLAAANMLGERQPFKLVSFYTAMGFGLTIAFAGDVRSQGRQVITRGPQGNTFARLIVDEHDELVGATFINRTNELASVCKLIEKNVKVSPIKDKLADPTVDLGTLAR
ncbi:MAG: FAD-dependent pyridine nucleotide-disulfide oxidoreductase [Parcubacteria group bacterium Gr01-1014_31]|nr:MAG: FAD-dependent pyridine nucleotide-disulfide oxidoreductase [Parcubacteria group bacterium Gr01-1014_31]